jgi:hypothetical protein
MEPLGPILMVLSIPMILRWVPQNPLYGFRIPATCKNKSVWYDANALAGRHMFVLGVALVVLDYVLPLGPWATPVQREIFWWASIIGLVAVVAVDWRIANRWSRERQPSL